MAAEEKPSQPIYGAVKIHFDQPLGKGAYGEVFKASCGPLPCAAKLLHGVLLETVMVSPHDNDVLHKFWEECSFLRMIKHPNIIQYLDTTIESTTKRPVLLMELLDESLTRLLDQAKKSKSPLAYNLQISICHDVALALAFLHLNSIIHRDLSSNNVLLMMGRRAKVADFGVSKVIDEKLTHLTKCPGSKVYMPPEALVESPTYTEKLDCFSFGVLAVQIATMNFPNPKAHARVEDNLDYPCGQIQVFVPEVERREEDIKLIDGKHPLLPAALNCLKQKPASRPSAEDLCNKLASIKTSKDGQSTNSCGTDTTTHSDEAQDEEYTFSGWTYDSTPDSFAANSSVALFDLNRAYFLKQSRLHLYEVTECGGKWYELINTTYYCSGLALIDGKLTTVGGLKPAVPIKPLQSKNLLSTYAYHVLTLNTTQSKWEEEYPKIPTGREYPTCVTTADHLIVFGGASHSASLCVEVLNIRSSQWSTATSIPNLKAPQVVQCEDFLYLSGSENDSFYRCVTSNLLKSVEGTSEVKKDAHTLWVKLQSLPIHQQTSIITFRDQVLAIGGESEDSKDTNLIYRYNKDINWWVTIGKIPTARKRILAGIVSSDTLFCVGGRYDGSKELKGVEVAKIV